MSIYEIRKTLKRSNPQKIYYMFKWKVIRKRPDFLWDNRHPCIFVLSTGRVGTETMAAMFMMAKNVNAYHEPLPDLYEFSKKAYELQNDYPQDEVLADLLLEGFMSARRDLLHNALYCDHGYAEAGHSPTFLAPLILKTIPEAKFIHLVRNPQSVVNSGMRRGWYKNNIYDASRIAPLKHTEMGVLWGDMDPYQRNWWSWAETNRWINDFFQTVPQEKKLVVHAEDMFNADPQVISKIFDFLGSPKPSDIKIRHTLNKKMNAQKQGSFKEPEDWIEGLNEPLRVLINQVAEQLGYKMSPLLYLAELRVRNVTNYYSQLSLCPLFHA